MKYQRFEDLPVWKEGARFFVRIDALCDDKELSRRGDIGNQIHRASLSITNNIAEGFEQGSTQQFITHLYHAKGSAGEVRSILQELLAIPRFVHLKFEISNLRSQVEGISRQLNGLAESLQNTDIEGHRYLTDDVREQAARKASRQAFEARLAEMMARSREARESQTTEREESRGSGEKPEQTAAPRSV